MQGVKAPTVQRRRLKPGRALSAVLLCAALAALSGCIPPFGASSSNGGSGPLEIGVRQNDIKLAWDYDPKRVVRDGETVTHFRLYYRERGTREWVMDREVRARENLEFMISADAVLGSQRSRKLVFGVSSVTKAGTESPIHSSTDLKAKPYGGWYVHWTRP